MPWVRLDDAFYDHPKWVGADPAEIGVWVVLLAWSNRNLTDGRIPKGLPARMGAGPATVESLVAREALEDRGDDYMLHDYLEWQRSAEQIKELHDKRAAAGRRGADKTNGKRPASAAASAAANGRQTSGKSSLQPQPQPKKTSSRISDADFDDWWQPWPKKVDKAEARAKYRARRRAGASHADLCRARDNYAATVDDPRYCKNGATFLGPDVWQEWLNPPAQPVNGVKAGDLPW